MKSHWSYLSLALLIGLAVIQGGLLARRVLRGGHRPPPVQLHVGDTLHFVGAGQLGHERHRLELARPDQTWTAVLAFDAGCAHCETVAPLWRDWLARPHAFDVVAITRNEPAEGRSYAARHDWPVPIVSVSDAALGSVEHRFVSRTPWAFLFDDYGVLRYEGHGGDLEVLDSLAPKRKRVLMHLSGDST